MKSIKQSFILLFVICLILTMLYILKYIAFNDNLDNKIFNSKIKSANLSTDYTIDTALNDIEKLGLNTVNLPIVININNLASSDMSIDYDSQKKAIELIKILKAKGIHIILEPYPWIANGSEYETDWNPSDIDAFFWNWKTKVLKVLMDDVANPYEIDILNIGTGFNHMEYAHGYWSDLIDYVREHYNGLITYRTSWWVTATWDPDTIQNYEDKLNNPLFSKLDIISIAAYFELTDNDTNSTQNLVRAINSTQIFDRNQNVRQEIKNFYEKWDKPIFFGELGFPRTIKASIHPWDPFQSATIDNNEQANCFEAYKIVFENEPWFIGFSVFAIGEHSEDKWYYPSDESITIINSWYSE